MIYSQDFIFAMSKIFFYNPYIRIFWRGLHFCLCMLLQIYTKIMSKKFQEELIV